MFAQLIHRSILSLLVGALVAFAPVGTSHAASAQWAGICQEMSASALKAVCVLDQVQWQSSAWINFGGTISLSQTFVPNRRGPLCQVSVKLQRNIMNGAATVRVRVLRPDNSLVDLASRGPAQIPLGPSVQTFDFGCDGPAVGGAPFFRLVLDAQSSIAGAYGWHGIGGNLYPGGTAYRAIAVPPVWGSLGGWDFTFKLLMCA